MKKENKNLATVFHYDLYGKRELKYDFLNENTIASIQWNELEPTEPNFFLVNKNTDGQEQYEKGFKVDELFKHNACGIVTARDGLVVRQNINQLETVIRDFSLLDEVSFRQKYNEQKDSRDWTYLSAKKDLENATIQRIDYRPFDKRFIIYSSKSKGILSYPRNEIMKHMILSYNLGLLICKQQSTFDFQHIFITNTLSDKCSVSLQTKEATYHFPLYLYPETSKDGMFESHRRVPNLNMEIVDKIAKGLDLTFVPDDKLIPEEFQIFVEAKLPGEPFVRPHDWGYHNCFTPLDLLDYIYAVLHSPSYREKYKEFLKIDFPRVPYPKDQEIFWQLVNLGGEIREIHLLESPTVEKYITQYPIDGDNVVDKPKYQDGKVYINETQYFDNVSKVAWEFYIGGYQPAQKWLKDRKDRKLEFDDILHYQKIIVALSETDRLMKEIDKIEI
jgi:predicted helicase